MDGLYWETWYNDRNVSEEELGYIFYENKLLGVPRLRQLKVKNDSCTVHADFRKEIKTCYDAYASNIEDRLPFGLENGSAYVDCCQVLYSSDHLVQNNFKLNPHEHFHWSFL